MDRKSPMDEFLGKRLRDYDDWLEKGLISHSSRVIPVGASFSPEQWVLPPEQVLEIIKRAETVAVQNCACRSHYRRCDRPLEVCLLLNRTAEKMAARGKARHVEQQEAEKILGRARQNGLIHLSLYMPDHEVYAVCSCCICCCHDLQLVKEYGRGDLMVRSQYLALTNSRECIVCGDCLDICPFDARLMDGDQLVFNEDRCMGCGLCVPACPAGAVSMALRRA
ncbi:MAG: 4Fe-4S binding protein [Desulfobacter sp.]|nr:MAG: 4Fe-4S binding protein [Desulfobacter sp.]